MDRITLHHADILRPGRVVHLARASLDRARPKALHNHDFFELLWVQNGRVRHHLPDRTDDLTEGDLLCLGPTHAHALQGRGEAAMVVSLVLHPDLMATILARHPDLADHLFWANAPVRLHRDSHALATLNHAALRLERSALGPLDAEAFLLPLIADLSDDTLKVPDDAPTWLTDACIAAQRPEVYRDGAAGFVRIAGRAHPHVSRTARRFLGQSPSEYVNAIRMAHAARQLSGSAEPLAEIAADCGIPNLSHFHRLFRARHGQTPAQYRQRFQRNVVQPTG